MRIFARILTVAILASLSNLAVAASDDKTWSGILGVAAASKPQYVGDDENQGTFIPLIIVDYKDTAYFNINRAGWWFWKPNEAWRVGAVAQIRTQAWDKDDGHINDVKPLPSGFDDPDTKLEPGINVRYKMDRFTGEAQVTAGEDVNALVELKYNLMQTAQFVVTAALGIEFLSEDEVNYQWYGDKGSLDNDSATNVSVGVTAVQTLNPSWKLLYGMKFTSLDDEIDDSPVGQDDTYALAYFGAGYSF